MDGKLAPVPEAALDSPQLMRQTVLAYVDAINAHDVNGIINLMSENFSYTNSAGDTVHGRAYMRQEWRKYFDTYPDFEIHVERVIADENGVAVFGSAEGTYATADSDPDANHWHVRAAYLGLTQGGKITVWQSFSDNSIVFDIISEHQAGHVED